MPTRIRYAVFVRQILLMVVPSCLLPLVLIALPENWMSPGLLGASVAAWFGLMAWLIFRHINGDGTVTLDEGGLTIAPRRYAWCATAGTVRIAWTQIETVRLGATEASAARIYTILKTRRPRCCSWILLEHKETEPGFSINLVEQANAARARLGTEPLEVTDPYNSTGWRIFAVCMLLVFIGMIIISFATGQVHRAAVWGRIAAAGCIAIPLMHLAFRSRRKS